MTSVTFTVIGTPEPKGSAKIVPLRRTFPLVVHSFRELLTSVAITSDNPKVKRWQKTVAAAARRFEGLLDRAGAFAVTAAFLIERPQHVPKDRGGLPIVRDDVDKLARALLDALSGVLWDDDGQVVDLAVRKRYAPAGVAPRVDLTITPVAIGLPLFPTAADAAIAHVPEPTRALAR